MTLGRPTAGRTDEALAGRSRTAASLAWLALLAALVWLPSLGAAWAAPQADGDEEVIEPTVGPWLVATTSITRGATPLVRIEGRRTHDDRGYVRRETSTRFTPTGDVASVEVLRYGYDETGMLVEMVTTSESEGTTFASVETWVYNDWYVPIEVGRSLDWDGDGAFDSVTVERYHYDGLGYLVESTYEVDEGGVHSLTVSRYRYDEAGRPTLTVTAHDGDGDRVLDSGSVTVYRYDELGRLLAEEEMDDGGGRRLLAWTYDAAGRPVRRSEQKRSADGGLATTTLTWQHDEAGRETREETVRVEEQSGANPAKECRVRERAYDDAGRCIEDAEQVDADGDGTWNRRRVRRIVYDDRGDVVEDMVVHDDDGDGEIDLRTHLEARYDARGRLMEVREEEQAGAGTDATTTQRSTTYEYRR